MLSATLLYRRNAAVRVTALPFSYSWVGSGSLPAGPVPLMPNRLWSLMASSLWAQPDSSMACDGHRRGDAVFALRGDRPWRDVADERFLRVDVLRGSRSGHRCGA